MKRHPPNDRNWICLTGTLHRKGAFQFNLHQLKLVVDIVDFWWHRANGFWNMKYIEILRMSQ